LSKLISAIRKQWQEALGEPEAPAAEAAMRNAHRLLAAIGKHTVAETLAGVTVEQFLGPAWVRANPWAWSYIADIAADLERPCPGDVAAAEPR
jgi:hypothetical protein